jgi:hypothetical protein
MAIFGPVFTYFLLKVVSRRLLISIYGFAGTLFWLLLASLRPYQEQHPSISAIILRGLSGVTIGGFSTMLPVFMIELAPRRSTGLFGVLFQFGISLGFFLCYSISKVQDQKVVYSIMAGLGAVPTLLLAIFVWFIPEVPADWNEGDAAEIPDPLMRLETLCAPHWMWSLTVCLFLMVFQQTTGVNVVILHHIESKTKEIIPSGSQMGGCIIGAFLIQKIGPRAVWTLSLGVITIVDAVFTIIMVLAANGRHPVGKPEKFLDGMTVPFMVAYGLGAGPIPWSHVPDIFAKSLKMKAMTIIATLNWILAFTVVLVQVIIGKVEWSDLWWAFLFFEILSAIGAAFGFYWVKSLGQGSSAVIAPDLPAVMQR